MNINDRIKNRRLELGLTLKDLADKLGVAESTVSRYESSNIKNMGIDKLQDLARALSTTPSYLMGWRDKDGNEIAQGQSVDIPNYFNKEDVNRVRDYVNYVASSYRNESHEDRAHNEDLARIIKEDDINSQ